MRRKNVKGVNEKTNWIENILDLDKKIKFKKRDRFEINKNENEKQQTRQNTINFVKVDLNRIVNLAIYVYIFSVTILQLALTFTFFVKLMKWISILIELTISTFVMQINVFVVKKYVTAQNNFMKTREQ